MRACIREIDLSGPRSTSTSRGTLHDVPTGEGGGTCGLRPIVTGSVWI